MHFLFSKRIRGQTLLEYLALFGIVTALVAAMSPMVKRFTQSMVRITADQIGAQAVSDQRRAKGFLEESKMQVNEQTRQTREDRFGDTIYYPGKQTQKYVYQKMDLGISRSTELAGQKQGDDNRGHGNDDDREDDDNPAQ